MQYHILSLMEQKKWGEKKFAWFLHYVHLTNEVPMKYQWSTNEVSMKYQWSTNEVPVKYGSAVVTLIPPWLVKKDKAFDRAIGCEQSWMILF